jgi:hypothetical protein
MSKQVDNVRAFLVPVGFLAFLMIAADLLVEFIEEEPIIAMQGIRLAMFGVFALAFIGVLYVLNEKRS